MLKARPSLFMLVMALAYGQASAFCFAKAADRYQMSEALLRAIALTESGYKPTAVHKNSDGTVDIGVMQINSSHLDELSAFGISRADLFEPCTNVMVGAWILALSIQRHGFTWRAVGSYNSGMQGRDVVRARYVSKVKPVFDKLQRTEVLAKSPIQTLQPTVLLDLREPEVQP